VSLPFPALGALFALGGFGLFPLPGKINAPPEVIGSVGMAFFLA
jgi:hypothetical protein